MWALLPICDIVSGVYRHLVYSLEVNDVSTQVAGASESFMQLKREHICQHMQSPTAANSNTSWHSQSSF